MRNFERTKHVEESVSYGEGKGGVGGGEKGEEGFLSLGHCTPLTSHWERRLEEVVR